MPADQGDFGHVLWWALEQDTEGLCRRWIATLSARHGGPRFEPHVTLAAHFDGADVARDVARRVAGGRCPELILGPPEHRDDVYQSLVLPVAPNALLLDAWQTAREALPEGVAAAAPYRPHVSLYYGPLSEAARAEAVRLVSPSLGRRVSVNRLQLWRCPGGSPTSWRLLESFPLCGANPSRSG